MTLDQMQTRRLVSLTVVVVSVLCTKTAVSPYALPQLRNPNENQILAQTSVFLITSRALSSPKEEVYAKVALGLLPAG
jgi:hypothetical protein